MIDKTTHHCQHEFISILTYKKIKNKDYSFIFYKGFAIFNKQLKFYINLVWTTRGIFTCVLNGHSFRNDVMTFYVRKLYGIVDIIKNQTGSQTGRLYH